MIAGLLVPTDSLNVVHQALTRYVRRSGSRPTCRQLASRSPQLLDRISSYDLILVLPHMHHYPAQRVELLVFLTVSGDVSCELRPPPLAVVLRKDAVVRACMPETAIHENGYPRRSERKIWATGQQCIICSVSKTTAMQLTTYKHFRRSRRLAHLSHLRGNSLIQGNRSFSSRMVSQNSCLPFTANVPRRQNPKPTALPPTRSAFHAVSRSRSGS
jgi:hypothetical protein